MPLIDVIILKSPSSIMPSLICSKMYKIKTLFSAKAVVLSEFGINNTPY